MPSIRAPATKKPTTLTVSVVCCFCYLLLLIYVNVQTLLLYFLQWFDVKWLSADLFLQVAVKCRPLTDRERGRNIIRVIDNKVSHDFGIVLWSLLYDLDWYLIRILMRWFELVGSVRVRSWPVQGLSWTHTEP